MILLFHIRGGSWYDGATDVEKSYVQILLTGANDLRRLVVLMAILNLSKIGLTFNILDHVDKRVYLLQAIIVIILILLNLKQI